MTPPLRTSAVITRTMTVVLLQAAVLAVCMGGRLFAQAREAVVRPPATAMVSGVVVGDDTLSAPIRRALLTLSGGTNGPVQVVTDDAGRFTFEAVAAGTYTLTAEKPAYVKTFYGSRRPGRGPGMPIAVTDSQRVTDLTVRLMRGGVIAGTVFDHNGRPAASTQVTVLQPQIVNGERRLVAPPTSMPWVTTDDRGRYRFFGLPPGEYTVRSSGGTIGGDVRLVTPADLAAAARRPSTGDAAWSEPPQIRQAAAFHPASADASGAVFFTLAQGEERAGIDIRLALVRTAKIDGLVVGPGGLPLQNIMVGIGNISTGSMWSSPGFVRPGPDGRFSVPGMPPGRYVFFGRGSESASTTAPQLLWTETEVVVNEQDVSTVLQFQPGATVSGRLARAGTTPDGMPSLRIALTPVPTIAGALLPPAPVTPQGDGTFALTGVAPGRYRVAVTGGGAWSLRSAILNGRDTLDTLLDVSPGQSIGDLVVTITDRPTEVSGTLFDHVGKPAPGYAIVIFSTDREHWTMAPRRMSGVVRLRSDGTYRVTSLPPGESFLSALIDIESSQLSDAVFLDQLVPASIKIVLSEGERKVQDLRLGG